MITNMPRTLSAGLLFAALAMVLCIPVAGAQAGGAKAMTIYQMTWEGDNVEGELYINDFFINNFSGAQAFGGLPLNPYLVGENEVRAEVRKKNTTKPAQLTINVSAMTQGEIAASNQPGSVTSLEIKDAELKPATTVKAVKKFSAPLDFSSHLRPTGTASGKEATEYTKMIYELFRAKKIEALMKELEVKISDYAAAYPGHDFATEFRSVLTDMLRGKLAPIDLNQLRARKAGPGGKVWQILEGKKELIRIIAPDGSESDMAVYVGVIDRKLKVVR